MEHKTRKSILCTSCGLVIMFCVHKNKMIKIAFVLILWSIATPRVCLSVCTCMYVIHKYVMKMSPWTDVKFVEELFYQRYNDAFVSAITIPGKTNRYVDRGQRLLLLCNATGNIYPPEDLDWFKDGRGIGSDRARGIKIEKTVSLHRRTIQSTLEISRMSLDDAGTYVCRASKDLVTNVKVNVLNGE